MTPDHPDYEKFKYYGKLVFGSSEMLAISDVFIRSDADEKYYENEETTEYLEVFNSFEEFEKSDFLKWYSNNREQWEQVNIELHNVKRVLMNRGRKYSPVNILLTGVKGISVRLLDKIIRLLSMYGLLEIFGMQNFMPSSEFTDESIQDTFTDIAGYSIIAKVFLKDKWGK